MKDVWKGLRHLYPNAEQFRDFEVRATADGDQYIAVWNLAQPKPTDAELTVAITTYEAAQATQQSEAVQLRQQILTQANNAVGVPYANITNGTIKALIWILLWRAGALNKDLTIKPLGEWVKD